jgi:hypothetical protein
MVANNKFWESLRMEIICPICGGFIKSNYWNVVSILALNQKTYPDPQIKETPVTSYNKLYKKFDNYYPIQTLDIQSLGMLLEIDTTRIIKCSCGLSNKIKRYNIRMFPEDDRGYRFRQRLKIK